GETWPKGDPAQAVKWHTDEVFRSVLPIGRPAAPTPPRPPRSSGKMKVESTSAPPTPKTPWIVATRAVFPAPGVATGFVVLTWDAGPDHPDAELRIQTPD